jgi:hypothetical protein
LFFQQQASCQLKLGVGDELMRRHAVAALEHPREVIWAHAGNSREVVQPHRRSKVRFDVVCDPPHLAPAQPALRRAADDGPRRILRKESHTQQLRSRLDNQSGPGRRTLAQFMSQQARQMREDRILLREHVPYFGAGVATEFGRQLADEAMIQANMHGLDRLHAFASPANFVRASGAGDPDLSGPGPATMPASAAFHLDPALS